MSTFRFAIMGAGNIAHQFCDAVTLVEDCEVSAIASKDLGRAQKFAEECSVAHAYDNYEQMLIEEKPDCVYIAVTPNDHFRLTMLCLEHRVPVLCEKAMFTNSAEAKAVFEIAEKIFDLCKEPRCFEEILQRLFADYGLKMNFEQYVLVGSTVRSYLSWLKDTEKLSVVFENNRLLWAQK